MMAHVFRIRNGKCLASFNASLKFCLFFEIRKGKCLASFHAPLDLYYYLGLQNPSEPPWDAIWMLGIYGGRGSGGTKILKVTIFRGLARHRTNFLSILAARAPSEKPFGLHRSLD